MEKTTLHKGQGVLIGSQVFYLTEDVVAEYKPIKVPDYLANYPRIEHAGFSKQAFSKFSQSDKEKEE